MLRLMLPKDDDVRRMVDIAVNTYGTIDIAINNAGFEGTPGVKTTDYEETVWDRVIDINLKGVWLSMKYEIPVMLKAGKGVIINISSLAGIKAGGAGIGYHAAKFGAVGITKSAALEYAEENIRINVICPAVIETPMADRAFDSMAKREAAVSMHPIGRLGAVDEVVNTISWLASEGSSFVTGAIIPVDGGASL
ncbi:SDR family oxidoreductase [Fulvivirgaceae bacterium BMA12]|uniref:SDR family oxidoreductase n=1 Tax=Agaribacillus aureus TaxID=3051825 RepID=A0ABT8LGY8_9BACT|nr:SDR family oxidoreductase [Fulvivirgaceae bacterium BMA12]